MTLVRVKKRDGREVPFDVAKIQAAIEKAMAAVGETDATFASEVAGVVALTLENRYSEEREARPGIEEIQDLVEQALIQLGQATVAKAYILYRDRRARIREALAVHRTRVDPARIVVQENAGRSPWSKGRIVAALMHEADLSRELAERVAARVEERVFDAGFKRISTALVRELVDNELLSLGLASALRRQATVGIPRHDLRELFAAGDGVLDPARAAESEAVVELALDARLSGELQRRYAQEELFEPETIERHLAGDLHLVDLARPTQSLWIALQGELIGVCEESHEVFGALEEWARLTSNASHGTVLENPFTLLAPLLRERRGERLLSWLEALRAVAHSAHKRFDLCIGTERAPNALGELVRALAAQAPSPFAARLFVDETELARTIEDDRECDAALEILCAAGRLVPTWSREGARFAAPGCQRLARERNALAAGGAAALNLPRLAWRSGPWREDRFLELLSDLVAAAADGLARLALFQKAIRPPRAGELRGRAQYALAPVGLREALQLLGDGEIRPAQGARILGFLRELARRLGDERRLTLVVTPFFGERARARFALLDAELPQRSQALLFDTALAEVRERDQPYAQGLRLSPVNGLAPWGAEAELFTRAGSGALFPLPEERSRGEHLGFVPSLRRFLALRRDSLEDLELTPAARVERDPRALFPIDLPSPSTVSPRA